ncbi:MAG TPA: hypothetical protein VK191_04445 [Symbiobacteriaceae bacterium]|nr:hypothetical protein [Symbiobacteriaceae bacterium]
MPRKKMAPEPNYWQERWLDYIWFDLHGYDADQRPSLRRRAGIKLSFAPGRITAEIPMGSYGDHCTTTFRVSPLGKRAWKRVLDKLATTPDALRQLMAGRPGEELEAIMAELDLELFPSIEPLDAFRCHCNQWRCNHPANLVYAVGEQVAQNPFLWLNVMGLERGELLAGISARQADAVEGVATHALATDRFWSTPVDPDQIPVRPGKAVAPDALLRRLGQLPLAEAAANVTVVQYRTVESQWGPTHIQELVSLRIDEALGRYAIVIGQGAARLAQEESLVTTAPAKLPGRAVPAKQRLLPEIVQAIQETGQALPVTMLSLYSPTAPILNEAQSRRGIADAVAELPEPYGLVGRFYVADRTTLLDGARFRHSLSFVEWYERRLTLDSDWVRALTQAGIEPPYLLAVGDQKFRLSDNRDRTLADLFDALNPSLGETLELVLIDKTLPMLTISSAAKASRASQVTSDLRATTLLSAAVELDGLRTEEEGVGILLAGGLYAAEPLPSPVWLLSLTAGPSGPACAGPGRQIVAESWRGWQPRFGRKPYGRWYEADSLLRTYTAKLRTTGIWNSEQLTFATRILHDWLQTNPGAQNTLAGAPSLGSFLFYLWLELPARAHEHHWPTEHVPDLFAGWFNLLVQDQPDLADHFGPHLAACALTQQFQHRVLTRSRENDWYMEGMRWIGPKLIFQA